MKTVPILTTELEKRITDLIQGYELVTGMRVGTIHTLLSGDSSYYRAGTEATVSVRVDDRKVKESDPERKTSKGELSCHVNTTKP